jgi:hypothetical protein
MQNLQEQQRVIDAELVQAMIESTPESWGQMILTLTRPQPTDLSVNSSRLRQVGDFVHELSSPEGYPPVGPADSLFKATYKLDELLQSACGFLVKAIYIVKEEAGEWGYHAEYEYEKT